MMKLKEFKNYKILRKGNRMLKMRQSQKRRRMAKKLKRKIT